MTDSLLSPEALLSFFMLSTMEVVLGIDNLIFIGIVAGRLPPAQRESARKLGLAGAFFTRVLLLLFIGWIAGLTQPLFTVLGLEVSGKSLILFAGGLFLIYKATTEIHHKLEGPEGEGAAPKSQVSFWNVIAQIMVLDIVFSLDSVITAVGMSSHLTIMIAANAVALGVMLAVGGVVNAFIEKHPTLKILALSFLLMIGLVLVGEGMGFHIPKGYIYFAMGFSIFVEVINIVRRSRAEPVRLHEPKLKSE
jgi:predicted tellurium resistance membrane protein TerC